MVLAFISENSHEKTFELNDFKVYYNASQALFSGGQVYGARFGLIEGYYKYSPFIALLAKPFTVLPYYTACVLQYCIMCIVTITMLILLYNLVNKYLFNGQIKAPNAVLLIVTLCFITHLVRELIMGNVNLLLLFLLCLSLQNILQKRFILAGILLALVLAAKPFFVLLFIPLLLHKYFKTFFTTVISLGLFAIIPAIVTGINKDIALHKQWLGAMLDHSDKFHSPNTLDMLIRQYISPNLPDYTQYMIMLGICILYIVLFYFVKRSRSAKAPHKDFIIQWLVLIALMPTLFKTDTQHFLFSVPLLLILCSYLFTQRNIPVLILFIVSVLLYDGNSYDLFGRQLSNHIYNIGLLGIGNILIITLALITYFAYMRRGEIQASPSIPNQV